MILTVTPLGGHRGRLEGPAGAVPCVLGRGGVIAAADKREGDGTTPIGRWPLRRLLFRPDRLDRPRTGLPVVPIAPSDGWCDDPSDRAYNAPVPLPYGASAERLWRDDGLYDLLVVLGHNDAPPVPGMGSAIFLHVAAPDGGPTAGCVALDRDALRAVLVSCDDTSVLVVTDGSQAPA